MRDSLLYSRHYLIAFGAVTLVTIALAFLSGNTELGFAAAILGLYVLHLLSLRYILRGQEEQWQSLRQLESVIGELGRAERLAEGAGDVPPPAMAPGATAGSGSESAPEAGASPRAPEGAPSGRTGPDGAGEPSGGEAAGEGAAEGEAGAEGEDGGRKRSEADIPIPRHFALGTVAIIKGVLDPEDVAMVLRKQRERPRERFGELAVRLGLLGEEELEALLLIQREGLFRKSEIREARERLEAYQADREELVTRTV